MNILIFLLLLISFVLNLWVLGRQGKYQKLLHSESDPKLQAKIRAYAPLLHQKQIFLLVLINGLLLIGLAYSYASTLKVQTALVEQQKMSQTYYQAQQEEISKIKGQLKAKAVTGTRK